MRAFEVAFFSEELRVLAVNTQAAAAGRPEPSDEAAERAEEPLPIRASRS